MAKTNAPKTTKTRASKKAAANDALVLHHAETIEGDDAALNALIAELNGDEVVETPVAAAAAIDDATLEAAVSGAEAVEAAMSVATPEGVVEGSAAPTGTAGDVTAAAEPAAKKERAKRKFYTDKTERLRDKLGTGLAEYSVLTMADAGVSDEELTKVMDSTMAIIKSMNKKEQNWAVKFIEYLAGKKSAMSEPTARILSVLKRDGFLTTGNDGNVFKDLVSKPYSAGAARAMGGNNIGMLRDLKVIVQDAKGKYVANPDSLLLAKANSMLFAAAA